MDKKRKADLRRFVENRAAPNSTGYTTHRHGMGDMSVYKVRWVRNPWTLWFKWKKKLDTIARVYDDPDPEVRIFVEDEWFEQVLQDFEKQERSIEGIERKF